VRDVATLSVGQNGYARTALAASPDAAGGALTYALELLHNDGPFTHPDDYQKVNGVLRYSRGYANNGWSVTAMAYHGRWNATDQIPERAVTTVDASAASTLVDDTDGGEARRYSLSGVWRQTAADSMSKVNAYIIRNQLDLWSNFTYFMDDPVNGDQFAQPDRRVTSRRQRPAHLARAPRRHGDVRPERRPAGAERQHLQRPAHTQARQTLDITRQDHIVETSRAAWIESATRWGESFRSIVGLRADGYRFRVHATTPPTRAAPATPCSALR
jgi:hypothetical protein